MKSGTPDHPKLMDLQARLNVTKPHAVGVLECLWHWTAKFTPAGNVGRYPDIMIAQAIGWTGDPEQLVEGLVEAGWIDRSDEHRLVVHDWPDHCEDSVHLRLARATERFADGSIPRLTRMQKEERKEVEAKYAQQ